MKDQKDVWIEAYEDAVDDGHSPEIAEKIAAEKVIDHISSLIDDAKERMKYGEA